MKKLLAPALAVALVSFSGHADAAIVASNDFDAPLNLTSSTSSPVDLNSFSSPADAWGVYNRGMDGPFDLFDETVQGFNGRDAVPTDGIGIANSTKTDNFFGIGDTDNNDTGATSGVMTGEVVFDISSATNGLESIQADFAAMGDFEGGSSGDSIVMSFSIDGSAFTEIFSTSVNDDGSKDYTMESGEIRTLNDPMSLNGIELSNQFQTISADVSGAGSNLTLRLTAYMNGGGEMFAFDNIVVNGVTAIPEPSSALFLGAGLCGLVTLRRRRNG